jgi:AcrR family transcriptional regulator
VAEGTGPPRPPIWARPPARRRSALSREAIVDAALAIADAEGIGAVSIRRVAAELGARTMSLYGYIDSKDDLFDLMSDRVAGEAIVEGEMPAGWREAVSVLCRREREVARRHPWLVDLANHRSHVMVGPNGLRHLEQTIAAMAGLNLDPRDMLRVTGAITDYMLGFVTRETRLRRLGLRGGATGELAWLTWPYARKLAADGGLAHVTALLAGGVPETDDNFERGLAWLLDGIEREYGHE